MTFVADVAVALSHADGDPPATDGVLANLSTVWWPTTLHSISVARRRADASLERYSGEVWRAFACTDTLLTDEDERDERSSLFSCAP